MTEILLVEDNPNDVELTLDALRENQISNTIRVVRDGAEALDFLFRRNEFANDRHEPLPGLILLDLKLPKVDGLQVLKELKADRVTRRIPVVMLTASREERDVIASYELGVNSYIVKPVDFTQFNDAVKLLGMYWLLLNEKPVE